MLSDVVKGLVGKIRIPWGWQIKNKGKSFSDVEKKFDGAAES